MAIDLIQAWKRTLLTPDGLRSHDEYSIVRKVVDVLLVCIWHVDIRRPIKLFKELDDLGINCHTRRIFQGV